MVGVLVSMALFLVGALLAVSGLLFSGRACTRSAFRLSLTAVGIATWTGVRYYLGTTLGDGERLRDVVLRAAGTRYEGPRS